MQHLCCKQFGGGEVTEDAITNEFTDNFYLLKDAEGLS